MKKKIFFHFGMHKTGSSYIQTLLANAKSELKQERVFLPEDHRAKLILNGVPTAGNGLKLSRLIKLGKLEEAFALVSHDQELAEVENCDSLLYSSESFFHLFQYHAANWLSFEQLLIGKDIELKGLLFFRDPVEHIISTFRHRFKDNYIDFERWLANDYETHKIIKNFLEVKPTLETDFGYRNYSANKRHLSKCVFEEWLGYNWSPFIKNETVNKSLNISDIYLGHLLRPILFPNEYKSFLVKLLALDDNLKPNEESYIENLINKTSDYLLKYRNLFEEINKLLPVNEALQWQYINKQDVEIQQTISFSNAQLEIYSKYLQNVQKSSLKRSLKIIRKELFKILKMDRN
ncbi:hypothetical protein [Marivirga sp.]|uniref:hypothetical protein n=1 Tax=Marivirga sp. TaxID=2018662 RepID=UPI003DA7A6E2